MADFEETSVSGFQQIFAGVGVVGCRPSLSSPEISVHPVAIV